MADLTNVTFEELKSDLIDFLSKNDTFKSLNFTATAMNTLCDALVYTAQYITRYANFALNESYLDTAQLRSNVVSLAKSIGYVPHQYNTSKAKLRIRLSDQEGLMPKTTEYVPADTIFNASGYTVDEFKNILEENVRYIFRTVEKSNWKQDSGNYWYADLNLVEGEFITETFSQASNDIERFKLSNKNIDTNYITVTVYEDVSDTAGETYTMATEVSDFDNESKLYFIEETYDGFIEVYFGDGILANKLSSGNIVEIKYLVCSGDSSQNIVSYSLGSTIKINGVPLAGSSYTLTVLENSIGSTEKESIESIRYNAPKFYQTQNRAVTTKDYNTLVLKKYSGMISSIVSWGGEEDDEPTYATVFICIKPKYVDVLSSSKKTEIINYLKTKNVPCVDISIVDPEYMYVRPLIKIEYNSNKTLYTEEQLLLILKNTISSFFDVKNEFFDTTIRQSELINTIYNCESSIQSVLIIYTLSTSFSPNLGVKSQYDVDFMNNITPGSVSIGPWNVVGDSYTYYFKDDSNGNMYLYKGTEKSDLYGTVDYDTGKVSIKGFSYPSGTYNKSYLNFKIECVATPEYGNLSTKRNILLELDSDNLIIQLTS